MRVSNEIQSNLAEKGFAFAPRGSFILNERFERALTDFRAGYARMPRDRHLNSGEGERFRRYARLRIDPRTLQVSLFPHDHFFQSKTYDVLYGDIHRSFSPLTPALLKNPFFLEVVKLDFLQFQGERRLTEPFEVSVHMIRIAATRNNSTGRPAPEGIHRDGYHYAGIHLMERHNLSGAESRVYDLNKEILFRAYLNSPLDSIYLDDRKVFHGVEPFEVGAEKEASYRDILILLYQPLSESPQRPAKAVAISQKVPVAF